MSLLGHKRRESYCCSDRDSDRSDDEIYSPKEDDHGTCLGFVTNSSKLLANYYLECDEDITLSGSSFQICVKLGCINKFIPVMKTQLETKVGKGDNDNSKSILVKNFDQDTVSKFVNILQERNEKMITDLTWDDIVRLIGFSHFNQCDVMLRLMIDLGKNKINRRNIYNGISVMDKYDIHDWTDNFMQILRRSRSIMRSDQWKELIENCPKAVALILTKMHVT